MKTNNFIQRIKENIKVLYILSLIFVAFAFFWLFLYSWQSDKDAAIEYLENLSEKDPSEGVRILNELSDKNQSRRKLSIFKDLKINMDGRLPSGIFKTSSFYDIYCIDKDIYVLGYPTAILRLQKDGKWIEETIESKEVIRFFGIWGNTKKGIFAVGTTKSDVGVILRRQGDGNWKREKIESKDVKELPGIWGNNEKGIFAVGKTIDKGVILRRQGDGKWVEETIENKEIQWLSGIWGNNVKGIFAVGRAESDGVLSASVRMA